MIGASQAFSWRSIPIANAKIPMMPPGGPSSSKPSNARYTFIDFLAE
jgi:hypothetical protein